MSLDSKCGKSLAFITATRNYPPHGGKSCNAIFTMKGNFLGRGIRIETCGNLFRGFGRFSLTYSSKLREPFRVKVLSRWKSVVFFLCFV